jgi:hypothetical protein
MMLDRQFPRARYRRLAQDCLETAQTIQNTEARTALIEMAQVRQRLANAQKE